MVNCALRIGDDDVMLRDVIDGAIPASYANVIGVLFWFTTIYEFPEQAVTIGGTIKVICLLLTVRIYVTEFPQIEMVKGLLESTGNPVPSKVAITPPPGLLDAGVIEVTVTSISSATIEVSSAYPTVLKWTIGLAFPAGKATEESAALVGNWQVKLAAVPDKSEHETSSKETVISAIVALPALVKAIVYVFAVKVALLITGLLAALNSYVQSSQIAGIELTLRISDGLSDGQYKKSRGTGL